MNTFQYPHVGAIPGADFELLTMAVVLLRSVMRCEQSADTSFQGLSVNGGITSNRYNSKPDCEPNQVAGLPGMEPQEGRREANVVPNWFVSTTAFRESLFRRGFNTTSLSKIHWACTGGIRARSKGASQTLRPSRNGHFRFMGKPLISPNKFFKYK
jgi:hypothetical protein